MNTSIQTNSLRPVVSRLISTVALLGTVAMISGCAPDKELLKETKFSSALRQEVAVLEQADSVALIPIKGTCDVIIDGIMYAELVGAGADKVILDGPHFTAVVSSDDVFGVANLEFIRQLELGKRK